jgi:hypothetical protein
MSERTRRVLLLADALAREMAHRDHELALGDAGDGLAPESVTEAPTESATIKETA